MLQILNYINGELKKPSSGKFLDNLNPATGKKYSEVPNSNEADVHLALRAAETAFTHWSKTSVEARAAYLRAIARKIHDERAHDAKAAIADVLQAFSWGPDREEVRTQLSARSSSGEWSVIVPSPR